LPTAVIKNGAMPKSVTNGADSARRAVPRAPAWYALVILALAPLWLLGMFDRGLWTPDEPREADIAWRMSQQSELAIPHLANTPFLEKPPLTYWLSAASISALGESAPALRVPNLAYALIVAAAVGTLAAMMAGRRAAIVAALVCGSALLSYRVAIWLAPDAALLAGCAVALAGAYAGYISRAGGRKFWGYTLMHAGAAFGFMAKSAPGWLVPGLALLGLIVWERRWSELTRWELYAGALLQLALIGPWIAAVAYTPAGAESLRVFFWDNLVGRFTAVAAVPGHDYAQGHLNWWGKYWVELPAYLLPWTVLAAAALKHAWNELRAPAAAAEESLAATPWRFAVCAFLPFLVLLSLATTARDVYAGPSILGFALLIALWSDTLAHGCPRFDQACLAATRLVVAIIACVLACALGILAAAEEEAVIIISDVAGAVLVLTLTFSALRFAAAFARSNEYIESIFATYAGYALAFVVSGLLVLPVIDRWQNLGALARRIEHDAAGVELAVLNPDETTIAMLDYRLRATFTPLSAAPTDSGRIVADWLQLHDSQARILVLLPGHAPGDVTRLLSRWHTPAPANDGVAAALETAGSARIVARYELAQGRRYALLAAAPH
jgi:4-amino-4-deoxy-L-arabinose transferase-like glycosyltransferase